MAQRQRRLLLLPSAAGGACLLPARLPPALHHRPCNAAGGQGREAAAVTREPVHSKDLRRLLWAAGGRGEAAGPRAACCEASRRERHAAGCELVAVETLIVAVPLCRRRCCCCCCRWRTPLLLLLPGACWRTPLLLLLPGTCCRWSNRCCGRERPTRLPPGMAADVPSMPPAPRPSRSARTSCCTRTTPTTGAFGLGQAGGRDVGSRAPCAAAPRWCPVGSRQVCGWT